MIKQLVFATHNLYKTNEVRSLLQDQYEVLNLNDIGCTTEIPETADSFTGNAELKSSYVFENFNLDCFADDSGLQIKALGGAPGIMSARYSGGDDAANVELVLKNLTGIEQRDASFTTVISLVKDGVKHLFEGTISGTIRHEPAGSSGFGYDPIFQPDGYMQTFAEMSLMEKNAISHRAIAMRKLIAFLKEQAS